MRIDELLTEAENDKLQQMRRDAELISQAQMRRWEEEQLAKQKKMQASPVSAPAPTTDQIVKHPQFNTEYQKALKQIQANNEKAGRLPNPQHDAAIAKRTASSRIASMIQGGQ